jgi:6-phosphogluconolactonase (cycloisomerase 2 family)
MHRQDKQSTPHLKAAFKDRFNLILSITLMLIAALSCAYPCGAQDFLYAHNIGSSLVSGYSVSPSGTLTQIAGTVFPTAKFRSPWGVFVSSHSASTLRVGSFLYIANGAGSTVSSFGIDRTSGALTPISDLTTLPDVTTQSCLSASFDGRFLFQGFLQHNIFSPGGHSTINVFRVRLDGTLEPIPESPYIFPRGLFGLAVSPSGRFLAVGQWFDRSVAIYEVDSSGRLTPVSGSPFATGDGLATNLEFNCEGDSLFVLKSDVSAIGVFSIDEAGLAKRLSDIPLVSLGGNPSDFLITPNGQYLFATNLDSNVIHAFKITANHVVQKAPGSPFPNPGGRQPKGLQSTRLGRFSTRPI